MPDCDNRANQEGRIIAEDEGNKETEEPSVEGGYAPMKWCLEVERKLAELNARQDAIDAKLTELRYGMNHHTHDKTKETPTFDCI